MLKEISWDEFRSSGALWWVNQQLHLFGLAICTDYDDDGNFVKAYPAECKFRGFSKEINDKSYMNLTNYLNDNMPRLKECTDAILEEQNEKR